MEDFPVIVLPLFYMLASSSASLPAQNLVRVVIATVGENVLLPCNFSPNITSENMTVKWALNHTDNDTLVYLYEDGFNRNDQQNIAYKGRTALFTDELKNGNASLKLTNVTVSDEADYTCSVGNQSWSWETSTVQIKVKVIATPRVFGPEHPIIAMVYEDILLPCYLSPNLSVENLTVRWVLNHTGALVHLYKDGCDRNDQQDTTYSGRTALIRDRLRRGNVSLKLTSAKLSDEGNYSCSVQGEDWCSEISMQVIVKARPHGPSHPIIAMEGEDVLLPCYLSPNTSAESMTIRWMSKHALVHLREDKNDKNDQQDNTYRGRTRLLKDGLRRGNASLELISVKVSDEGEYTCSFLDGQWYQEITLWIKVEGKPTDNTHSWKAAFSIMFLLALALAVGLVYQAKGKLKDMYFLRINTEPEGLILRKDSERTKMCEDVENMRKHGVNVVLDPVTAHPQLILSTDGKQVTSGDAARSVTPSKERFATELCVLAREGFTQGRHYYEVLVRGNRAWTIGLLWEHIDRHGPLKTGASNLYFALQLRDGTCYSTESSDDVVQLREDIQRVGVFLDYDEGIVSFYDVEDDHVVHLYSYTQYCFSGTLFPIFSPGLNSGPLVILPVWEVEFKPSWTCKANVDEIPL